ncbi:hypothetical protein V1499_04740 [Neobacillus sp. SCS-31]|uniref:hypothetical protein n=1 Tax=Neobacillus oceani TaxID=3115292 RepID=UPI0039069FDB
MLRSIGTQPSLPEQLCLLLLMGGKGRKQGQGAIPSIFSCVTVINNSEHVAPLLFLFNTC